jgi:FkbM family methyltransferase
MTELQDSASDLMTMVDAGARYGVFPAWKECFNRGNLRYIAFDPDPDEAQRLEKKYEQDAGLYSIHPKALFSEEGHLTLNIMKHRGGNSLLLPATNSVQFETHLVDCSIIEKSVEVPCIDLDSFCQQNDYVVDFMKIDTEGSELSILQGAQSQLSSNVVGLYLAVHFNPIYEGASLIDTIMKPLTDNGFYLVNLDYSGKGAARNPYIRPHRYGVLMGCYSLWLKKIPLLENDDSYSPTSKETHFALKQALAAILHDATDIGLEILLRLANRANALELWRQTPLFNYIDLLVQRLFRDLREHPAHDEDDLATVYQKIFNREFKKGHYYFQSDEVNPR